MFSSCRIRWHRALPVSSSRLCRPPKPPARPADRRPQVRDPEALRLVEQAITRDPRYGPALAWGALCCFRLLENGRSEDREVDRGKGIGFARRALEAAGDDPGILANAAIALAYFGEDIGTMMALVDRALALNPELRAWLAPQRCPQAVGGAARCRDRAYRCRASPQSPRPRR